MRTRHSLYLFPMQSLCIYPKNRKDSLFYIQKTVGFLNIKKWIPYFSDRLYGWLNTA